MGYRDVTGDTMKNFALLLVLAALAGIAGWLWFGRNTLTEEHVRAFYAEQADADESLAAAKVCAAMSQDFISESTTLVENHSRQETSDREGTCENVTELFAQMRKLQDISGGRIRLESTETILGIDISDDDRQAVVKTRSMLRMPGMNVSSRSTDTLIRVRGKVLIKHAKVISWVGKSG